VEWKLDDANEAVGGKKGKGSKSKAASFLQGYGNADRKRFLHFFLKIET
jgi:hypothetical protein